MRSVHNIMNHQICYNYINFTFVEMFTGSLYNISKTDLVGLFRSKITFPPYLFFLLQKKDNSSFKRHYALSTRSFELCFLYEPHQHEKQNM